MENTELGVPKNNNQFQILVDSDAFVGRAYPDDAHHQRASEIFRTKITASWQPLRCKIASEHLSDRA